MNKIFAIIKKDVILRFAGASELLFFIVMPLVFTFLLAGGTPSGDEDPRIRVLVADEANTVVSRQIVDELERSTAVRPVLTTREDAQEEFDGRRASTIFIIPAGVDAASLQAGSAEVELLKQPNNLNATVVERAVQTAIRRVSSAVGAARNAVSQREARQPFQSDAERQAYFDYERQQGTLRRVLVTPTSKAMYLFGTILGQTLMALAQMALLVLFGIFVMKLAWGHAPLALFVVLTSAALAAAAFGVTLGAFVKTEGQATGLSIMFGMVFALMGGCWYPLELFPPAVQSAVKVLPTTWAMQGLLDLVLRGRGLADILPEAGALLGFAAVFFAIGVWRFRYE
ncbi:ABC transporter permease [Anaerolineae bacterium AMX1]|nr:ABC transporter permease [Anaerolineae bacterium AMX1]